MTLVVFYVNFETAHTTMVMETAIITSQSALPANQSF